MKINLNEYNIIYITEKGSYSYVNVFLINCIRTRKDAFYFE